jgi:hypothetical protein
VFDLRAPYCTKRFWVLFKRAITNTFASVKIRERCPFLSNNKNEHIIHNWNNPMSRPEESMTVDGCPSGLILPFCRRKCGNNGIKIGQHLLWDLINNI